VPHPTHDMSVPPKDLPRSYSARSPYAAMRHADRPFGSPPMTATHMSMPEMESPYKPFHHVPPSSLRPSYSMSARSMTPDYPSITGRPMDYPSMTGRAMDYPTGSAMDYPSMTGRAMDYPSMTGRAMDYPTGRAMDYPSMTGRAMDYPTVRSPYTGSSMRSFDSRSAVPKPLYAHRAASPY
jgi:hypothetical protein